MACPSPNSTDHTIVCGLPRVGDSLHCMTHAESLRPIYLKYKAINIDDILATSYDDLAALSVQQLLKFISRVERVYKMRVEYRAKAFVPAMWDRGHDKYIEKCVNAIYTIREILNAKFTMCETVDNDSDEVDNTPNDVADNLTADTASSIETINNICEAVATAEADWGDSEAITQYRVGASRLYITLNVLKSMMAKIYTGVNEDHLYSMTIQIMIYLTASYRMYVLYRKAPSYINVAKFRCRINWVEGTFLYNHKVITPIISDFIKKCTNNPNLLRGFMGACVDKYDEFVDKSTILYAQKVSTPVEGFQLRIKGAHHAYHIVETPTTYMWRFDYIV